MSRPSFSDAWYQVCHLNLGLLPTVRVHKQIYRDQQWYVLQDACSEKYFRVQASAYAFIAQLTPHKTVEAIWQRFCETHPEQAPTQSDVIALLSQLHQHNLLFFRSDAEHEGIFARQQKTRRKEKLSHLMAFLYFRIPIWNPNRLLVKHIAWLGLLLTPFAFLIWLLVAFMGGHAVLSHIDLLWTQTQGVLAVDNLIWLFVALFFLKFAHEMGHAIVCQKYGGQVHTIGIMFIALMPLPYTDASASWSLRSKWQRSMVSAAGMYVELFIAGLAAVVWSQTAPGVINSLAFNLMLIGSVSSLVFNGNPLLKFDSYYILSDVLGLPNLYQKASQQWFYLGKRLILNTPNATEPAENSYERRWFLTYGLASFLYRLFVMVVITLYMADLSLILGVLIVLTMTYIWVVGPAYKLLHYLQVSPELHKNRGRARMAVAAGLLGVVVLLSTVPMPHGMRAPGVVESSEKTSLFADAGGRLVELMVSSGDQVSAQQPLMRFTNPELALEYELMGQQLIEVRWLQRRAVNQAQDQIRVLQERERTILAQLDDLERRLDALVVRAPHHGVWISPIARDQLGAEFNRAESLGTVIDRANMQFIGVVSQTNAAYLFDESMRSAQIRVRGHSGSGMTTTELQFIPYERTTLPSAALAITGGGPIAASPDPQGQMRAQEPFFEVIAQLPSHYSLPLHDGALGYMRIRLAAQPPLQQLNVQLRQLLQGRYRI